VTQVDFQISGNVLWTNNLSWLSHAVALPQSCQPMSQENTLWEFRSVLCVIHNIFFKLKNNNNKIKTSPKKSIGRCCLANIQISNSYDLIYAKIRNCRKRASYDHDMAFGAPVVPLEKTYTHASVRRVPFKDCIKYLK